MTEHQKTKLAAKRNLLYSKRRETLLLQLKAVWCAIGIAFVPLVWLELTPQTLANLAEKSSHGDAASVAGGALGIDGSTLTLITLGLMISPLLLAAWKTKDVFARWMFSHFFDSFNNELFDPIRYPTAPDHALNEKPLKWLLPSKENGATQRLHVWNELHKWVHEGSDLNAANRQPFSWALLVGRPGAGKSRTADEFARSLARRDLLGDHPAGHLTFWRRWLRLKLRFSALWRRARRKPALADPWDAGRPAHKRAGEIVSLKRTPKFFDQWYPRAPTLIIFEDPTVGEAESLVQLLAEKLASTGINDTTVQYKFPVRLLIVNQTVPADLRLWPNPWRSELPYLFDGGLWVIDEASYLNWTEFTKLREPLFTSEDCRRWGVSKSDFERITCNGNPLLVESFLHWLQTLGNVKLLNLTDITPAALLKNRAERVQVALIAAQLSKHQDWCVLAAAGLVDGLKRDPKATSSPLYIEGGALQRVFPNEAVSEFVPAIRPALVAYAFADLVVEAHTEQGLDGKPSATTQTETASQIASIAWTADPYAVMSLLSRLTDSSAAGEMGARSVTRQLLISALETVPDNIAANDPLAFASAFARYHMDHGRALPAAATYIARLSPLDAQRIAFGDVFEALERPGTAFRDVLAIFSLSIERVLGDEMPEVESVEKVIAATKRLAAILTPRHRAALPATSAATATSCGFKRLGLCLVVYLSDKHAQNRDKHVLQLINAMWGALMIRKASLFEMVEQLSEPLSNLGLSDLGLIASAMTATLTQEPDQLQIFSEIVPMRIQQTLSPESAMIACQILALIAYGYARGLRAEDTEKCADAVGAIAEQFLHLPADSRLRFAQWHAECWRSVGLVHMLNKQPVANERCARKIESIAAQFCDLSLTDRKELAICQAEAWGFVTEAHLQLGNVGSIEHSTDKVIQITAQFHDLPTSEFRLLAEYQATAWARRAHVCAQDGRTSDVNDCVIKIGALLTRIEELQLEERLGLAENLGTAWARLAHAHALAKNAREAELCATKFHGLSTLFAVLAPIERTELARQHMNTWRQAAKANASNYQGSAAERCAKEIERLLGTFADLLPCERFQMALVLADAWSDTASAYVNSHLAFGAERCAENISQLAKQFLTLPLVDRCCFAINIAQTLRFSALAHAMNRQPLDAERCANKIAQLEVTFSALPQSSRGALAELHALAWAEASFAHGNSGHDLDCVRCIDECERIIAPWIVDPEGLLNLNQILNMIQTVRSKNR
ncbi:MAG: hypothetical protein ABL862_07965 [Candidatus Nitrotoga sp.]